MIVVDTSVWIDHLRGRETPPVLRLRNAIAPDDIVIGDLILLEILQGARDDAHAAKLERAFRQFKIVPMLSDTIAVEASRIYRHLRSQGVTVRKTVDLVIAAFCLSAGASLLQDDRDFRPIADRFGLSLI